MMTLGMKNVNSKENYLGCDKQKLDKYNFNNRVQKFSTYKKDFVSIFVVETP